MPFLFSNPLLIHKKSFLVYTRLHDFRYASHDYTLSNLIRLLENYVRKVREHSLIKDSTVDLSFRSGVHQHVSRGRRVCRVPYDRTQRRYPRFMSLVSPGIAFSVVCGPSVFLMFLKTSVLHIKILLSGMRGMRCYKRSPDRTRNKYSTPRILGATPPVRTPALLAPANQCCLVF